MLAKIPYSEHKPLGPCRHTRHTNQHPSIQCLTCTAYGGIENASGTVMGKRLVPVCDDASEHPQNPFKKIRTSNDVPPMTEFTKVQ
jgi:hypothetical protein